MASEKFVIIRACTHRAKANAKDKAMALISLILINSLYEQHIKIMALLPKIAIHKASAFAFALYE